VLLPRETKTGNLVTGPDGEKEALDRFALGRSACAHLLQRVRGDWGGILNNLLSFMNSYLNSIFYKSAYFAPKRLTGGMDLKRRPTRSAVLKCVVL
jgi:hypothetical protein